MSPAEAAALAGDFDFAALPADRRAALVTNLEQFSTAAQGLVHGAAEPGPSLRALVEPAAGGIPVARANMRRGRLIDLMQYLSGPLLLNGAASDERQRADWLLLFNRLFAARVTRLGSPAITAERSATLLAEIAAMHGQNHAAILAFCAARGELASLWARRAQCTIPTDIYRIIAFMHLGHVPFGRLTADDPDGLLEVLQRVPPTTPFAGFAVWGAGDHADAVDNEKSHFVKHVLDGDPVALDWTGETTLWWLRLNIQFRRSDAAPLFGGAVPATIDALFPAAADGVLAFDRVVAFLADLRARPLPVRTQVYDWFDGRYRTSYGAAALYDGRNLTDVAVHYSRGVKVSGRRASQQGGVFVVGRLIGGVLTISSCYYAQDIAAKINDREVVYPVP